MDDGCGLMSLPEAMGYSVRAFQGRIHRKQTAWFREENPLTRLRDQSVHWSALSPESKSFFSSPSLPVPRLASVSLQARVGQGHLAADPCCLACALGVRALAAA